MDRIENDDNVGEWDMGLEILNARLKPIDFVISPLSADALAQLPVDPVADVRSTSNLERYPAGDPFTSPFVPEPPPTDMATANDDSKAAQLHREAYDLYKTANATYQGDNTHKFPYIQIRQGLRSTTEQARLYEAYYRYLYYDGPVAVAANQPGKSFHEYGFAIDVVRGDDEILLADSLESAGWQKINADEGWHFEARGAASFTTVQTAIQTRVIPVSTQYVKELDAFLKLKQQYDFQSPAVLAEEQRLRNEDMALRTLNRSLILRAQNLQRRRDQLQKENADLNNAAVQINVATQRYNSMVYNLCPNREPFERCTHTDLKNQWLAEKKAAYDTIVRMTNQYNADRARYQTEYAQYNRDVPILAQDKVAYQRREQIFQRDRAASRRARAKLSAMLAQSQQHRSTAATLVGTITTLVSTIRQGL
ncbi:D-alanyl-D-alanine carboxypeptidase family protein [Mesorhizobium sp. M0808]|uniref:D-alanyl-D-alanine carboxypeptidase family protein n=1 Tax=Mesorhizobium sp. M0808 TaxID=2957002 RepID=UPI0033368082